MQWQVATVSLFDTVVDPAVQISRSGITMDKAREIAANSDVPLPTGPSDITTLDLQAAGTLPPAAEPAQIQAANAPITAPMVQAPTQIPPAATAPPAGARGWQDALRRELAHCANQGFFERPTCSWNARNKYCAPNRAWGTIAECPRKVE